MRINILGEKLRKILLYTGGSISFVYVIIHVSFWKLFNWNEKAYPSLNPQVCQFFALVTSFIDTSITMEFLGQIQYSHLLLQIPLNKTSFLLMISQFSSVFTLLAGLQYMLIISNTQTQKKLCTHPKTRPSRKKLNRNKKGLLIKNQTNGFMGVLRFNVQRF